MSKLFGAWVRAWLLAAPRYRAGPVEVAFKHSDWASRGLASWEPGWKAQVIRSVLASRPGLFLDVGANIGQTLLDYLTSHRPGYIGFEPNSLCVTHIENIIEHNGLSECRIVPVGLSDANGVATLYLSTGEADPSATALVELRPVEGQRAVTVPMYRLDDIWSSLRAGSVSLIKIDVEGLESKVLAGMTKLVREQQPWILCEVLHRDHRADRDAFLQRNNDLMQLLDELGYEAHRINRNQSDREVIGLDPVSNFPDRIADKQSNQETDYLFVPRGSTIKI